MTTSKQRTARDTAIIAVSSLLFVHLLFWLIPGVFKTWNFQTTDQLFRIRASVPMWQIPYDSTIVHVDEKDTTTEKLHVAYLARHHYARVVQALGDTKAAAQIYDYIFRAPTLASEDSLLFEANRSAHNAYYGIAFSLVEEPPQQRPPRPPMHWAYLDSTSWRVTVAGDISHMLFATNPILTFPELAQCARGLGYLSLQYDEDGVFRRAPLLVRLDDKFYPSFPFRAVCDYLSVTPERVVVNPGNSITLKDARRPGQAAHDIVIPVDEQCNLLINFLGPWHAMTHYEFADVHHSLDDRDELEYSWTPLLQGKIVVVSQVGTGAADVAPVPTDNNFPLSGVHANVLNTILTERFLREASPLQMFALEIFLLAVVYLLALKFLSRGMWIGALLVLVGFLAVSALLFFYGNIVLNIVRPSIMIGIAVFAVLAYRFINEEREKEAFRRSFESYLPPSVVKRMVASPESMFDAEKKELTILFSDIKSFTTYSSTMTADRIQSFLAEYFEAMVGIIFKYEGTVDKYIGDGLMVFFGAPAPQADHAVRAAQAAIEMQRKCRELKVKWEREGLFPLRIRIGINTGEVVVGNMGTPKKLAYTVLGAPVNLANRLESNAPVEGILVSKRTYELIQNHVPTKPHPSVKVKGLEEDIEVYEVVVEPAA